MTNRIETMGDARITGERLNDQLIESAPPEVACEKAGVTPALPEIQKLSRALRIRTNIHTFHRVIEVLDLKSGRILRYISSDVMLIPETMAGA